MARKKAERTETEASKSVIYARIVPLALVKKRLRAAQDATDKFRTDRDGQAWTKAEMQEHGRLEATEANARIDLTNWRFKDSKRKNVAKG